MAAPTGAVVSGEALLAAVAARAAPDTAVYKADDLTYDVGLLAAFDAHPVDPAALAADREAALLRVATENAQLLVKRVFELPVEMTSTGPVVRGAAGDAWLRVGGACHVRAGPRHERARSATEVDPGRARCGSWGPAPLRS